MALARAIASRASPSRGLPPASAAPSFAPQSLRMVSGDQDQSALPPALLEDIRTAALAVYTKHGLPSRAGHYVRSSPKAQWRFLGETLTSEERWALVLAQGQKGGSRFASIEELGSISGGDPELVWASEILSQCAHLRSRIMSSASPDLAKDIDMAIGLGVRWRRHDSGQMPRTHPPLQLSAPKRPPPRTPKGSGSAK